MLEEENALSKSSSFITEITDELIDRATDTEATRNLSALFESRDVLREIFERANRTIDLKAGYNEKCRAHNQFGLFNLLDTLTDYEIDETIYDQLAFRETLIISKVSDSASGPESIPVGGMCISVQKAEGTQPVMREMEAYEERLIKLLDSEGITDHTVGGNHMHKPETLQEIQLNNKNAQGKFVVHVSSQFEVDGRMNAGSTITSWVDRNMHTLEELRKEYINETKQVNEKSLYLALKNRYYYVKHTSSVEGIDDRKLYSVAKARTLISEGASIILERYLAIKRYYGKFELSCAYINGDLCRNIYECFGPEGTSHNGQHLDVCKIQRTIIEECGVIHKVVTILTLEGRILKQEWQGCDYVLHINPQAEVRNAKPPCVDELLLANKWEHDMQLMSEYLDQKDMNMLKNRSYMLDHPELKSVISDYVNCILLLRPPDIMNFTFEYFGRMSRTATLPRTEYFE